MGSFPAYGFRGPSINVIETLNVIFTKVASHLHFDYFQRVIFLILQSMFHSFWYKHTLIWRQ